MTPSPRRIMEIGSRRYPLYLGSRLLRSLGPIWSALAPRGAALVIFDEGVRAIASQAAASLEGSGVRVVSAPVPSGEPSKSLAEVERLCRLAATEGIRRGDTIVAVGGGVVGDLAGFVAASYQRGIQLVHVPTTLLAMVDSSIGGKTGVDLPEGKNYVGAIWQPHLVLMDVDALATLPARELSCGFAEVVKYGLLEGAAFVERIETWPALPGATDELVELIGDCVDQKVAVVVDDEHDLGRRAILNLGHTVGHGIEAAGGYGGYHHGEAISLGLLAALRLSERALGLDLRWRERTRETLVRHGLPVRLDPSIPIDAVLAAMGRDKKSAAGALNMVLISAPGEPHTRQNPDHDDVVAAIEELYR